MWIVNNNTLPEYNTKLFVDIYPDLASFLLDYNNVQFPKILSNESINTVYYLLYARYGNNPIANLDENQFKYKLFSIVYMYGPTWEKRLNVQTTLRGLQLSDLLDDGSISELFEHEGSKSDTASGSNGNTRTLNTLEANTGTSALAHTGTIGNIHDNDITNSGSDTVIKNHATNPSSSPANDAFSALNYIDDQNAERVTKGTASSQDESNTTTYNNTDTTTNNLSRANTGTITDSGTSSSTSSGSDESSDSKNRTLLRGKLEGYEKLLELLDTDVTNDFIAKFSICFKKFVFPAKPVLYWVEEE